MLLQNTTGEQRSYQVVSTVVQSLEDLLFQDTVTPWLTLITCYPFKGFSPLDDQRFVVFAKEIKIGTKQIAVMKKIRVE